MISIDKLVVGLLILFFVPIVFYVATFETKVMTQAFCVCVGSILLVMSTFCNISFLIDNIKKD